MIPKFIDDAAADGAREGGRNDRAFWLAAQCRDARLSKSTAESLMMTFASRCSPAMGDNEAKAALNSAYRGAPREPPISRKVVTDADEIIDWNGTIGPKNTDGEYEPDYVAEVPAASGDPVADLKTWLACLYRPEDKVNYVVASFKDEDGKYKPRGMGVTRTREDIEADLDRYAKKGHTGETLLRNVLGDWTPEAGVWARINPLDGNGSTNANVVRLDHVLVEGDEQEIGKQIAVIRSLHLPCSAVVHSGGKSVHAVVKIDAGTDKSIYKERVDTLFKKLEAAGFIADPKCRNSSRLSRLPGPMRGGNPQYIISNTCGAESWDAWMAEQEESAFQSNVKTIDDLLKKPENDSLVGERFLCKQGVWLLVAQSGVGKSVFAIQAAISFSVGRSVFGLKVDRPLKNLMIQAENNEGDMHEVASGVYHELNFTKEEKALAKTNFRVDHCSRYTGGQFAAYLAHLCRVHKPDIVWVDPLLSYLGGEISKMQDTSRFLRNQLQPVIEDANIGLVVIHHTGKPPKSDDSKYKGADLAYLGIGSSDITNWARATSTLLRVDGQDNRFAFEHAKRSDRAGCAKVTKIKHAEKPSICWLPVEKEVEESSEVLAKRYRKSKFDGIGLETMPPVSGIWDDDSRTACDAARCVARMMESFGMDSSVKSAAALLRNRRLSDFLTYDKNTKTWQGNLYAPDFL